MKRLLLTTAFTLSMMVAAQAIEVDLNTPILDEKGAPVKIGGDSKEDATVKDVVARALFTSFPDEKGLSGEEKYKRAVLGTKIANSTGKIDLSSEDITLIKKLVGMAFNNLVVLRVWDVLDPKSVPTEAAETPKDGD